ncbi:N-6 DNA methylase [Thiobacillus thioparus]|uniref:N-6 DNA methylase n=1 Tax=Thiobacillus thioparus TaxID=931 RepID=UPI001B7FBE66|nr:N-6 DNA methylase [Thiobacillus thioparus]
MESKLVCGTGGFLLAAHDYVVKHYPNMTSAEKKLRGESFKGWELVQAIARLCAMNMLRHGMGSEEFEPIAVGDSLAADPSERFDVVLTNLPFGKRSSTTIVGEEGSLDIFWLKDESLSDSDNLPAPEVIAAEIVEDLEAALEQFREILADMGPEVVAEDASA